MVPPYGSPTSTPTGAQALAAELGGEAWTLDLTDRDSLAGLEISTDILINNAGIQHVSPIPDFDPEMFRRILMIMVEAPFLLIRAALPGMYQRGFGRIVNISSVHGLRASEYKSAYVTAKHGLEGLSKVTALEGAAHGVTSNCINPGYVRTPLVEKQIADQARTHGIEESEVVEKIMLAHSAIKRLVEPEEVASLVGWLVGPDAGMVTGRLVHDGRRLERAMIDRGGSDRPDATKPWTSRSAADRCGSGSGGPRPVAPVLAVHGITANHLAWQLVAEALPDLRIVAPDLRGRGRSSELPGPYGFDQHADDLAQLIDQLGLGPVPVVGHSMGGFVAMAVAHRHPDLISAVLLLDGGLPFVVGPELILTSWWPPRSARRWSDSS